jgi:trehalose 6-phosphate phosphatase
MDAAGMNMNICTASVSWRRRTVRPDSVAQDGDMPADRPAPIDIGAIIRTVRGNLADTLIALDFDGTLAPIVPDPADSRPLPGTEAVLSTLAGQGARVAVITGRDARTALRMSGLEPVAGLVVAGLYGAEVWHDGELDTPPTPEVIRTLRARLPGIVAHADPAVWIEDKRLSLVVHGRLAGDPEAALDPLRQPVAHLAGELGLEVHAGRGVIELRLPGYDKAGALYGLVRRFTPEVVVFAGDDLGDVPALHAVRELRASGMRAFGVGAGSADVPELTATADTLVDGPPGVLALLTALAH